MKFPTRLLTAALAVGAVTFAGVSLQSAFAQNDAAGDPAAGELADLPTLEMPEAPPAHDYATGPDAEGFESMQARVGYAVGVNIGTGLSRQFQEMGVELDSGALAEGIRQATGTEETKLSELQVGQTLQAFQQQMMEQQMADMRQAAEDNEQAAEDFFARNKDAEGVMTTDSGLQYRFEEKGEGQVPTEDQVVTLHYRGTLLDGTPFDSSYDRGEPAEFPIGQVIPGFQEALQLMPVGSEGTVWIPSELAYGMSPPQGSPIQPGSALKFDLEILGLSDQEPMPGFSAGGAADSREAGSMAGDADGTAGGAAANRGGGNGGGDDDGLQAPHRDAVAD